MRTFLLVVAMTVGVLTVVSIVRVLKGPTTLDRIIASSFAAVNSLVIIMVIGFVFGRPELFVDIGIAYAFLAFLFPLAFAKYLDLKSGA